MSLLQFHIEIGPHLVNRETKRSCMFWAFSSQNALGLVQHRTTVGDKMSETLKTEFSQKAKVLSNLQTIHKIRHGRSRLYIYIIYIIYAAKVPR